MGPELYLLVLGVIGGLASLGTSAISGRGFRSEAGGVFSMAFLGGAILLSSGGSWGYQGYLILIALLCYLVFLTIAPVRGGVRDMRSHLLLGALAIVALGFLGTSSVFLTLIYFEALLLISLNLLLVTSKSERIIEAGVEMFMWTVAGSASLLFVLIYLWGYGSFFQVGAFFSLGGWVLSFLVILGFGVKVPLWPCTSWLLKAHVEASVEFSILLSGFIVKLGLVGLVRVLGSIGWGYGAPVIMALCLIGGIEALVRLLAQVDLKRIVALTTVIEMNWLTSCFVIGGEAFASLGYFIALAHCLTTAVEFFMVEALSRRYHSRDLTAMGSLWYVAPALWYVSLGATLVTIGFPGTSLFLAKVLYLGLGLSIAPAYMLAWALLLLVALPIYFMRVWVPIWFGFGGGGSGVWDLTGRELGVFGGGLGGGLVLGLWPDFFLVGPWA